ncbi:hypothetical protein EJ110_NYTH32956 [Nymphaea thermarum]|nr:hypothetical protein EJ110_NYTH32956 [Nymphaea thermarum]
MENLSHFGMYSSFLPHLITEKLNHENYLIWKRQIMPFIRSQGLFGHLDGSTKAPPISVLQEIKNEAGEVITIHEDSNPEHPVWMRHDQSLAMRAAADQQRTDSHRRQLEASDDVWRIRGQRWSRLGDDGAGQVTAGSKRGVGRVTTRTVRQREERLQAELSRTGDAE